MGVFFGIFNLRTKLSIMTPSDILRYIEKNDYRVYRIEYSRRWEGVGTCELNRKSGVYVCKDLVSFASILGPGSESQYERFALDILKTSVRIVKGLKGIGIDTLWNSTHELDPRSINYSSLNGLMIRSLEKFWFQSLAKWKRERFDLISDHEEIYNAVVEDSLFHEPFKFSYDEHWSPDIRDEDWFKTFDVLFGISECTLHCWNYKKYKFSEGMLKE